MLFEKYKTTKNEDGSYNILGVPIFKLGKHKGFNFTKEWFEKVKELHETEEKEGYLPSVIIGHHSGEETEEKPAKGFFKNLRLKGKTILADLVKIPENFYNDLKERAYPHRSVEVAPKSHKITALALLGGTTPYHKLPILEVFKNDEDNEVLNFYLTENNDLEWKESIAEEAEQEEKLSKIRRIWQIISDRMWQIMSSNKDLDTIEKKTKEVLDEGTKTIEEEIKKSKKQDYKEDPMDFREEFKQKYGVYPEEMAEELHKKEIFLFCENLKTRHKMELAPAIVDEIIKPFLEGIGKEIVQFAEKEMKFEDAAKEMIEKIIDAAAEKKLFANMEEETMHDQTKMVKTKFDGRDDVEPEDLEIFKAIKKIQKSEGISFEEATKKYYDEKEE